MHIIKKVKRYFRGIEGFNCAQAVVKIHDHEDSLEHVIQQLNTKSGGRAPEGMCGALYGALYLTDKKHHQTIKNEFVKLNGSEKCKELKQIHHTPCSQCVESACRLVEQVNSKQTAIKNEA